MSEASSVRRQRRARWLWLHKWLGLGLGVWFAFMGLSGTALIFRDGLDSVLNPALYAQSCAGPDASLDAIVAAAHVPGTEPRALDLPRFGGPAVVYVSPSAEDTTDRWRTVFVDRHCARGLGTRPFEDGVLQTIYRLHGELLAGSAGRYVIACAGILYATSIVSGLVLWWPNRGQWHRALTVKPRTRGFRRIFDLHKSAALLGLSVLVLVVPTGLYLVLDPELHPLLDRVQESAPPADALISLDHGSRITVDAAVQAALRRLPDAHFGYLEFPASARGSFAVGVRRPHEASYLFTRSTVWVDQYSGRVVHTRDARQQPLLLFVEDWMFPLHDGQAFAQTGRILYGLAGVLPSVLLVTGALMWVRRRAARSRVVRRRAVSASTMSSDPGA